MGIMRPRYKPNALFESGRRTIRAKSTTKTAVLGDETQNIFSDRKSFYWARPIMSSDENGNAILGPVFYLRANPGAGILNRPGRRVFYKKNEEGDYQITRADPRDLDEQGIDQIALEPNDAYRAFRYLFEIVNLNSYTIGSDLLVNVFPWQYQTSDNVVHFFEGTTATTQVDLEDNDFIGASAVTAGRTSIMPTSADTHRFALLVFNITKHLADEYPLEVYPGVAIAIAPNVPLTINGDLQTCYDVLPTDEIVIPIKAYYLGYGQTEIAGISKDIDVRQFINVPSPVSIADLSPLTTKGDLFTYSTVNTRLPVGTNGQVLTVDSAEATGLKWDDPASGSGAPFVDTTAIVKGSADATKLLRIEVDGFTTATTRVLTAPNYDGTIATLAGAETLANKILSQLHLLIGGFKAIFTHAFTADRTVTLPGDADVTLVGESTTQNLSNKTINSSSIGVTTAAAGYFTDLRLLVGGFVGMFTHSNTATRLYTLPNYDGVLSTQDGAESITNKIINSSSIGASTQGTGYFSALRVIIGGFTGIFTHANTGTRTYTFPNFSGTMATLAGTETFTNKTLTTPTMADFTNAQHDHQDADDGGQLTGAAINVTAHNAVIGNGASGLTSLAPSTARNVMISDGTDWTSRALALADVPNLVAILRDEKTTGTAGGTSTSATWNARDLSVELYDPGNIVTISSNTFTPIVGDYELFAYAPFTGGTAAQSNGRVRLYNVTGAAAVEEGMSTFGATNGSALAMLTCKFTANGSSAYRIDTYTSVGRATTGLGVAVSDGSAEVYTCVYLRKIA